MHVFGMPALKQAMTDEGFVLADESVELVVASMDRNLTYEKLAHGYNLDSQRSPFYCH